MSSRATPPTKRSTRRPTRRPTDPPPSGEPPAGDPAGDPAGEATAEAPAAEPALADDLARSSRGPGRAWRSAAAVLRGAALAMVLAVLALGAAGLTAELTHPPSTAARAELTWAGDAALTGRLDATAQSLRDIADQVDRLAAEAKTALAEVSSVDATKLREALQRGAEVASTIDLESRRLRDQLADLPGAGDAAALAYNQGLLVRRAALLGALEATSTLAGEWTRVTGRAGDAAKLTTLIAQHDQTVVDAAEQGRASQFSQAIVTLATAQAIVDEVATLRALLVSSTDATVLDVWVDRNLTYDKALSALYAALRKSGGKNTLEVQAAYRDERGALSLLPSDRRHIIVIVAEVAQSGLNQAVLAIEEASGRIEQALATGDPGASPAP